MNNQLFYKDLGLQDYQTTWEAMKNYTAERTPDSPDELWFVQHPPVFTLGQAGKEHHILNPHHIPVVKTDRGGQVTYHGPGQVVVYVLIDLKRNHLNVRQSIDLLEKSVISLLSELNIKSYCDPAAPGVYINKAKICSVGLRIKRGCTYHGLALNVDMDLTPFSWINPCGYEGLKMTQLKEHLPAISIEEAKKLLLKNILLCFQNNALP